MARTKQTSRKGNKGLLKATKGRKGVGSGDGSDSAGGSGGVDRGGGDGNGNGGNGDRQGNVPGGQFRQQLEHRPPAAVPKRKKPYIRAFQEMKRLQWMTKLRISKYQMAR